MRLRCRLGIHRWMVALDDDPHSFYRGEIYECVFCPARCSEFTVEDTW